MPLVAGVIVTAADVLLILALQRRGFRQLETFIVALLLVIAGCFAVGWSVGAADPISSARELIPNPRS